MRNRFYYNRRPVVIEKTGKFWKALMLLGGLGLVGGFFLGAACLIMPERLPFSADDGMLVAISAFAGGAFIYLIGRLGAWWFHG